MNVNHRHNHSDNIFSWLKKKKIKKNKQKKSLKKKKKKTNENAEKRLYNKKLLTLEAYLVNRLVFQTGITWTILDSTTHATLFSRPPLFTHRNQR